MVCIAAFIVLLGLSVFSAKFREPLKKAWSCVGRRMTLRKCDSNFKDEVKHGMLKKVVIKHPKWVKPISVAIEIGAVLIIVTTVWSVLVLVKSGLTLYVHGTCSISSPSACVLDPSQACTIDRETVSFWRSPIGYTANWFSNFGEVIMAVPIRFKDWDAREYIPSDATYYREFDESKPAMLVVLDPGCHACKESYLNIRQSDLVRTHNIAFISHPIRYGDGYAFRNSELITRYLQAVRSAGLENDGRPTDWQMISRLFTDRDDRGVPYQTAFNASYSETQAERVLQEWLADFGFDSDQIAEIVELAGSSRVRSQINANRRVVENEIKATRIPIFIFDGRRHDGLLRP